MRRTWAWLAIYMIDVFPLAVEDLAAAGSTAPEAVIVDGMFPKFESGDWIHGHMWQGRHSGTYLTS